MLSGLWRGHTGRAGPGFACGKMRYRCEVVVGTGGRGLDGDAVLSPEDSIVAFGLAPCPGMVFRNHGASAGSHPKVDGSAAPGPGQVAQVRTDIPFSVEHGSAMIVLAISLC